MMGRAAGDPIWAITAVVLSPIRATRCLIGAAIAVLIVGLALSIIIAAILPDYMIFRNFAGVAVLIFMALLAFRLLINPLIRHFGGFGGRH